MILLQVMFDLFVLIALGYLYYNPKLAPEASTGKPKGYEIPHCYKCGTIQKVIKVGNDFVCQICVNH